MPCNYNHSPYLKQFSSYLHNTYLYLHWPSSSYLTFNNVSHKFVVFEWELNSNSHQSLDKFSAFTYLIQHLQIWLPLDPACLCYPPPSPLFDSIQIIFLFYKESNFLISILQCLLAKTVFCKTWLFRIIFSPCRNYHL